MKLIIQTSICLLSVVLFAAHAEMQSGSSLVGSKNYRLALIDLWEGQTKSSSSFQERHLNRDIDATKQNLVDFLLDNNIPQYHVNKANAKSLELNYLKKYYVPWETPHENFTDESIIQTENKVIDLLFKNPGWDENGYQHSKRWVRAIFKKMALDTYPNAGRNAIVINQTNLRMVPTGKPSLGDPKEAGEGFPFDNFQVSYLRTNIPLYITHIARDGKWSLVITPNDTIGWVANKDIAYVDKSFIRQWKKADSITPIKGGKPIRDEHQFFFLSRIGEFYPLSKAKSNHYEVFVAAKTSSGNALIKTAKLSNQYAKTWPLKLNSMNVAKIANQFVGIPYGWGGLYGYRDCSTTTRDIYAAFGIWLPRNSKAQADIYPGTIVDGLADKNKMKMIDENGIPFFSLLWEQGHVLIYAGSINGLPYAFHSPWGLHTKSFFTRKSGRLVIGRSVLTPLNIGEGYFGIHSTYIDKIKKVVNLVPSTELEKGI